MLDAAEAGRDLDHVAVLADRRHFQHVGDDELRRAVLGVLVEQFVENLSGVGSELVEEVPPVRAEPLGPLAPSAQRGVERQVADQVERVGVGLVGGLGQVVEVDAALFEPVDDVPAFVGIGPFAAQLSRIAVQRANLVGRVVGELHDAKLIAVGIEFVNQMGGDLDVAAVEVELAPLGPSVLVGRQFAAIIVVRLRARA